MVSQKKLDLVQNIHNLLSEHKNIALIKIGRTSHQTLEKLRKEMNKNQTKFKVVKNSLLLKAFNKLSLTDKKILDLKKSYLPLNETNALLLFSDDWIKALNAFDKFSIKEISLSFQFGLLDDKPYGNEELLRLAQLPPKDQIISHIIRSFKSSSFRLVYSMKFNLNKFVSILKEKSKKIN